MKKIKFHIMSLVLALLLVFTPLASVTPMQATTITVEAKSSKVCVAASGRGKCYHRRSSCSRMRGRVRKITRSKAKRLHYRACKKCYR